MRRVLLAIAVSVMIALSLPFTVLAETPVSEPPPEPVGGELCPTEFRDASMFAEHIIELVPEAGHIPGEHQGFAGLCLGFDLVP